MLANAQFALGLVYAATFVAFAIRARFSLPYRDDWDWLRAMLQQPLTLRSLFEPHNEHVIPLSRLLFDLQFRLEGTVGSFLFAVAVLTQLVVALALWWVVYDRWRDEQARRRFAWGAAAVCLFLTYQLQSIVFAAAVLFPLVQMFAVLACAGTALAVTRHEAGAARRWWVGAWIGTIGAAMSTTNGLIVAAVAASIALAAPRRHRMWMAFAVVQLALVLGYVVLAGAPWNQAAPAGQPSISTRLAFFLAFFAAGASWAGTAIAVAVGAASVAAGAWIAWRSMLRRGTSVPAVELFAAGVVLFTMATAAMTTIGRAQFGVAQAAQSRYATFAITYWAALVVWSLSRAQRHGLLPRWEPFVLRTAVALSVLGLVAQSVIGAVWAAKADNLAFAGLTLAAEVDDDAWVATLHPETRHVYEVRDLLTPLGRWDLADPRIGQRGTATSAPACTGTVQLVPVSPGPGWRLEGTLATGASEAVVLDGDGVVAGLARPMPTVTMANPTQMDVVRAVLRRVRQGAPHPPLWGGFVQVAAGGPYTVQVLDDAGGVQCVIAAPST
jgi:hypothetical protein